MKRKLMAIALSLVMFLQGTGCFVFANEFQNTKQLSSSELQNYDKYVKVQNNKFVLDETANIAKEITEQIQQKLDETNRAIQANNLTINTASKSAVKLGMTLNSEGINSIEFYWNYCRVYVSGTVLRMLLSASVGIAVDIILEYLGVDTKTAYSIATATVGGLCSLIGDLVRDGVWYDVNYFYATLIPNWGLQ